MNSTERQETRVTNLRWHGLSGSDREHLVLTENEAGIQAESVYMSGGGKADAFAVWYRIALNPNWHFLSVEARVVGTGSTFSLRREAGSGRWFDGNGERADLAECADVDLSITPFTNSLPIRRLGLKVGDAHEFKLAYIALPEMEAFADIQLYTRKTHNIYHFESVDSDFNRDIEVDDRGLVVNYPGLFARIV
jgi:uncharacterized protein